MAKRKNPETTLFREKKSIWKGAKKSEIKKIFDFAEEYKEFITEGKTEREMVLRSIRELKAKGFRDISRVKRLKPGSKIYKNIRGRSLFAAVLGTAPLDEGVNIVAAHIDSPRIDLKASPIVEDTDTNTLYLKTHYYGGIKKYHWLNIPLALHGVVVKADGTSVDICVGEDSRDPIFVIGDLLIHLSRKVQGNKKLFEAFNGESLNVFAGHWPHEDKDSKSPIKRRLMEILNAKYGIVEEDLVSADISAVPAGPARDVGFDRAMVAAYGQDDRVCSITAIKAIQEVTSPRRTAIVALYDKEEVGSGGNTGAQSTVLETFMTDLIYRTTKGANYSHVTRALENTKVLSADVDAAMHPNYKNVHEPNNAARLGHGIVLAKFSGHGGKFAGSEASAEYYNEIRRLFNKHKIPWQNAELGKVDEGGGGTVAKYLANFNMEVIDCGPGVLSMHSPLEITSKADIYASYRAYKVFLS